MFSTQDRLVIETFLETTEEGPQVMVHVGWLAERREIRGAFGEKSKEW
jgi:hypothetical protein